MPPQTSMLPVAQPMLAAILVALVAVVLVAAGPVKQCPWGRCDADDAHSHFMNLLQVRADSHKGVAGHSDDTLVRIKHSYPFYHTSTEIHDKVKRLAKGCGGALTMETLTDSGTDIDVVNVRALNSTPLNKVFILIGEHSRELIGPESGLRLLENICGNVALEGGLSVPSILQDSEFQIVLNGNPHSRFKVEDGDYCLRTNPRGVDLNRNWDVMWTPSKDDDTNAGPHPFSEPETRIFKSLVEKFQPTTFLTVHSGTRGMYMPWAYDREHAADFNAPLMLQVLKDLDKNHCQCPFGAAGKEVGYDCPGTCMDYAYDTLKTPYVFAFEIYSSPNEDVDLKERWNQKMAEGGAQLLQSGSHLGHDHFAELFDDFGSDFVQRRATAAEQARDAYDNAACFRTFNPGTETAYNSTVQNWAVAYLEMAAMIAKDLKRNSSAAVRQP